VTSDAVLISRSLAGDNDAFVEVVRRHAAAVSAYLVRRTDRAAAEDLLAEVWVAAFSARSSCDQALPDACPWLLGIARNVLRRYWRMQPGAQASSDLEELAAPVDPWPAVDEWIDSAAVVRRTLACLPAAEREVLLLVVWERLSVAEAARALGIPAGTARRRLHQARLVLRRTPEIVALSSECTAAREVN